MHIARAHSSFGGGGKVRKLNKKKNTKKMSSERGVGAKKKKKKQQQRMGEALNPEQIALKSSRFEVLHPFTRLENAMTAEFFRSGTDELVDLSATQVKLKFKVTKEDGSSVGATPQVYPIQASLATIWRHIEVQFNNETVEKNSNYYSFDAYLHYLLKYCKTDKDTFLQAIGYGSVDQRKALIKNSKEVELFGPLYSSFGEQSKLLVPNVDLRLRFTRQDNSFVLISEDSTTNYKLVLTDFEIHLKLVSLPAQHSIQMAQQGAQYNVTRRASIAYGLAEGTRQSIFTNIFPERVPRAVYITFVDADAEIGAPTKNPFDFKLANIARLDVTKGGVNMMGPAYTPEDGAVREYVNLLKIVGKNDSGLTLDQFKKDSAIFAFQFAPNDVGVYNDRGSLSVEVEFKKATTSALTMLIVADIDSVVEINKDRDIEKDF